MPLSDRAAAQASRRRCAPSEAGRSAPLRWKATAPRGSPRASCTHWRARPMRCPPLPSYSMPAPACAWRCKRLKLQLLSAACSAYAWSSSPLVAHEPRPGWWLSFPPQGCSPRRSRPCQPTDRELRLPWWIRHSRPGGCGLCCLRSGCWFAHPTVATNGLEARQLAGPSSSLAMASAARSRDCIAQLFVRNE